MKLAIGIDTGGTCTDAVLYDFDTNHVIGQSKVLTTYDDLKRGILHALDGLDPVLCRQAQIAGLSTTLATNACVEGKFRRARLLLMGIDRTGIARYGADYGFTDPDDICYLPCRTSITGDIMEEPDWDELRAHTKDWFSDAEACAICEIYGMRNGGILEHKAARIIKEQTGIPIVCASELFSGLSSLERAASALLNAGLLQSTQDFLDAVMAAFQIRGIHAPIFIMRSDGSLMGLSYTAEHAVETLLSGPAASVLGGSTLTKQKQAVFVDMGGTTTDVALVDEGSPILSSDGIRIGKWKTLVPGLLSTSFALGGDSVIRWDKNGTITLGPNRVCPLCVLASQHPDIVPILQQQIRTVPAHTLPLHEFLTLARSDWETLSLSESERKICTILASGPKNIHQISNLSGIDKYQLHTERLENLGVILYAGLTPTDIMHVRGDYTAYCAEASALGVRFVSSSLHLQPEQLCEQVYDLISRNIFYAVSQMLLAYSSPYFRTHDLSEDMNELIRLQWENRKTNGSSLLHYTFRSPAPLIGIGGPAHLFLPAAAQALHAQCIIPDYAATANAVGAAAGQMSASDTAEIRPCCASPDDDQNDTEHPCNYEVLCAGHPPHFFDSEQKGLDWAISQLKELTQKRVRAQGATGEIAFRSYISENICDTIKLGTHIKITATTCLIDPASKEISYV